MLELDEQKTQRLSSGGDPLLHKGSPKNTMIMIILGRELVKKLRSQVVLVCIDEAHTCLESQWANEKMREDMKRAPAFLKAQFQSSTKAAVLAMTATAQVYKKKKNEKRG